MTVQEIEELLMRAAEYRRQLPPMPAPTMVEHQLENGNYVKFSFPEGKVYQLPAREMNSLLDCVRRLYKLKERLAPVGWAILMNAAEKK